MNEKHPIERELRNLLSVDPSPGFEDRVRAHVFRKRKGFRGTSAGLTRLQPSRHSSQPFSFFSRSAS
jgi:hypothetical protein